MIRRNRSVIAELLVLIIIVIYASLVPSSDLSFAQNSDIRDNGSIRGSLLIVQEGVAHSTPEEAHSMKLEIMTEYFLDDNNDEIVVDNGLALGHFSLDDSEGIYFIKFSMLKILKISQDLTTIVSMVLLGKVLITRMKYHQLMLWLQFQVKSLIMNQSTSEMTRLQI